MNKGLVMVFLRPPEHGKVKTRLAAAIGAERALKVYEQLLTHTLATVSALPFDKQAWIAGSIPGWDMQGWTTHVQIEGDLGERMAESFRCAFVDGYEQVVIVGTDCPGLSSEIVSEAFLQLASHDVVIGPADDGGYYLLGLRGPFPELFSGIHWSTDSVATDTITRCTQHGRSYTMLRSLGDVDREQDLHLLELLH